MKIGLRIISVVGSFFARARTVVQILCYESVTYTLREIVKKP